MKEMRRWTEKMFFEEASKRWEERAKSETEEGIDLAIAYIKERIQEEENEDEKEYLQLQLGIYALEQDDRKRIKNLKEAIEQQKEFIKDNEEEGEDSTILKEQLQEMEKIFDELREGRNA